MFFFKHVLCSAMCLEQSNTGKQKRRLEFFCLVFDTHKKIPTNADLWRKISLFKISHAKQPTFFSRVLQSPPFPSSGRHPEFYWWRDETFCALKYIWCHSFTYYFCWSIPFILEKWQNAFFQPACETISRSYIDSISMPQTNITQFS